jgi:ribonuclease D
MKSISDEWSVPIENLLTPDTLRRLCWEPPSELSSWLAGRGARSWQISLLEAELAEALLATEPLPEPEPEINTEALDEGVVVEPSQ